MQSTLKVNRNGTRQAVGELANLALFANKDANILVDCGISRGQYRAVVLEKSATKWLSRGKCYDLDHAKELCRMGGYDNALIVYREVT